MKDILSRARVQRFDYVPSGVLHQLRVRRTKQHGTFYFLLVGALGDATDISGDEITSEVLDKPPEF